MARGVPISGVILAAGKGNRMGLLPTRLPKPVLPVLGMPIVYYQLRTMARLGIRKVIVVVGHLGFHVVREIEGLPDLGLQIDYVEQTKVLGIAHCVGCLEAYVSEPFMLFLGDIYFEASNIDQMITEFISREADCVLGAIEEEDAEAIRKNFCIVTDEGGRVIRVIEKPRHPLSRLKGVGIYLFSPVVFDAIRRTPKTAMRDEYEITDSIQILIDDGYHVRVSASIDADLNVTYPADLLNLNLRLLRDRGLPNFVGVGVDVAERAVLKGSVVGTGARIGAGASIVKSLVFSNAVVPSGERLEKAIVTESGVFVV